MRMNRSRARMNISVAAVFAAAIVAVGMCAAAEPLPSAPTAVTAIRAGRFIDVLAGKSLTDQIILIRDGKISAVGPRLTIPDGAKVVDLSTMTVLPGLIDCHTHLADAHDPEPLHVVQHALMASSISVSAIRGRDCAPPGFRVQLISGGCCSWHSVPIVVRRCKEDSAPSAGRR